MCTSTLRKTAIANGTILPLANSVRLVQTLLPVPGFLRRNGARLINLSSGLVGVIHLYMAYLDTPNYPADSVRKTGPCQPSMVFRYLRSLDAVSPPLSLTHLACQTTVKAFTATRAYHIISNFECRKSH